MEVIVLDYSDGTVTIFESGSHPDSEEIEKMIAEKGFRLEDCEWMIADKIKIERK